jgi:hypothetical protein
MGITSIFACGLECGRIGSAGQHWAQGTGMSVVTSPVRNTGRSLKVDLSSQSSSASPARHTANLAVTSFYVKFDALPSGNTLLYWKPNSSPSVTYFGLAFKASDGKIYPGMYSELGAAFAFGSAGVAVVTGQWYLVDIKVENNGSRTTVDVEINGASLAQLSSGVSSTLQQESIGSFGTVTGTWYYDDIVVSATGADYPIGSHYIKPYVPTADGTHNVAGANQFERGTTGVDITNATTDAFELVNEVPLDTSTPSIDDYIAAIAPASSSDYVETIFGPVTGDTAPTNPPIAVEARSTGRHRQAPFITP